MRDETLKGSRTEPETLVVRLRGREPGSTEGEKEGPQYGRDTDPPKETEKNERRGRNKF